MLLEALTKSVSEAGSGPRMAIVSDEASLTYEDLLSRTEALAQRVRGAGIGPGHVILAYLENEPAFLVALLASARVGAAFAPLDIGLTDAEVDAIVRLTGSDVVLCDAAASARCGRFSKNRIAINAAGEVTDLWISGVPAPSLDPQIALMQFSSGTTGACKGVLLGHEAVFYRSHYLMRSLGLTSADRTLCTLPLSHTHGAECLALPTLMAGGTLFLKSPKFAFPLYILEEIAKHGITFFSSIPQFYDFAVKMELRESPDIRSLRLPFCGSAALAKTTAESFFAKYGVHIQQGYGLAELSVICLNRHDGERIVYDSIGRPIEGIEWQLASGETEGELIVRSKAMFSGYINDEDATREKLREGWLHTGDVVSVDADGLFRVIGRKEDFIKVNGFKVYAAEVETAIIGLDWIQECAVLAEKDSLGTERIVAHVVPKEGGAPAGGLEAALIQALRSVLSDYKLPKRCVVWPELPKSQLGKINKAKLRTGPSTTDVATERTEKCESHR